MRNAAEEAVASIVFGARDVQRGHSEETKDDECKDPLESDDLDSELAQRKS